MPEKSIIIIGAGMAGLSAGCYAQMNGYRSQIFEMHDIAGGLCTAWKREGYTFDLSLHMLSNSRSGPFHRMWQELGGMQGRQFVFHDILTRIESGGRTLDICSDLDRLEQQMVEQSPADAALSREFVGLIRNASDIDMPVDKARELWGPLDYVKMFFGMAPLIGVFRKYSGVSLQDFAARFSDPFLGCAVRFTIDSPGWSMPDYPLAGIGMPLAMMLRGNASTPVGGSQQFAFDVERRYRALGGQIRFRSRVDKILVQDGRAVGVRLADGTEHRADVVISAADGHTTLSKMLGGRYTSDEIRRKYQEWRPVAPQVQVMLGVARDMSAEPVVVIYKLEQPITIAGEERSWLAVRHFGFDPTMAPQDKSVVQVWYPTQYAYWEALHSDRKRYKAEKKQIADATIAELDKRWPGFAGQVEAVDVPTPITYHRYTGNWQSSPDGWYITQRNVQDSMPKTLPGLKGFYMAGQWTAPYAGVPMSAMSGRHVIQLQCKQDRKRFTSTLPCLGS